MCETGSQEASRPDFRTPVEGSSLVNLALVCTMNGSEQQAFCDQVDSWEARPNNPLPSSGHLLSPRGGATLNPTPFKTYITDSDVTVSDSA